MNVLLQNFLKTPVRDVCAYVAGFLVVTLCFFYIAAIPNSIKSNIEKSLNDLGFKNILIKEISLGADNFTASDIYLDSYGLDTLKSIKVDLNWISYLTADKIKSIQIDGAYITRDIKKSPMSLPSIIKNLEKPQSHRIEFTNLNYTILTQFGDLRVTGNATITPQDDGYDIKASLSSTQHQMGFESSWHGKMSDNKDLDLFVEIFDGRINMGSLKISRTNGWMSLSNNTQGIMAQMSLNAGSAFLENTPLQNLSLQSQATKGDYIFSIRSGISGFPSTLLAIDFLKEKDVLNSSLLFETKNLYDVLNLFLKEKNKSIPDKIKSIKDFRINAVLKPELRFKGGPMPYDISAQIDDTKPMNGNILIYLDDQSVRGSLGINPEYTKVFKSLFNIKDDDISNDYLRIDKSFKDLIQNKNKN